MPAHALTEAAFDALGNAVRRDLLRRLATAPASVQDLAADLPISRPAVSKHLRILEEARLVAFERQGTSHVFSLRREGFDAVRDWLGSFWDDALTRFALLAENTVPDEER